MPRRARSIEGGLIYQMLNRSNARAALFLKEGDYLAFERILGYGVMPNHWQMVVWPRDGQVREVSEFLR